MCVAHSVKNGLKIREYKQSGGREAGRYQVRRSWLTWVPGEKKVWDSNILGKFQASFLLWDF
jgi:hypothetical protein